MPKKSNNRQVVRVTGSETVPYTLTHVATGFYRTTDNLSPAMINRIAAIGDLYQLYRYVSLKVTVFPTVIVNGASTPQQATQLHQCVAVLKDIADVAPDTVGRLTSVGRSIDTRSFFSTPLSMSLGSAFLQGESSLKWWKTKPGAATDWEELQGIVYIGAQEITGSTTITGLTFYVRYDAVVEFCDPAAASMTPMYRTPLPLPETDVCDGCKKTGCPLELEKAIGGNAAAARDSRPRR